MIKISSSRVFLLALSAFIGVVLVGCAVLPEKQSVRPVIDSIQKSEIQDTSVPPELLEPQKPTISTADELRAKLNIIEDYRGGFIHGEKPAANQKYIVLHDTEGDSDPAAVISWWDGNGKLVAAHFVIGKDGAIYQCVPMDKIAHHAGYGDIGHNVQFGITEDGRDDMLGSVPIGSNFPDYAMNAWSIGIELVHVGGSGYYPQEQLDALDGLIAYIDCYYDTDGQVPSQITDHKAWRSGNSDTSPEFAEYLSNYREYRVH
jgi:hypothetical protein